MTLVARDLGIVTADAEQVRLQFDAGALVLSFADMHDRPRQLTFADVLAFRWQELDEAGLVNHEARAPEGRAGVRDDQTYEVVGSAWLARQAELQAVSVGDYAHYMLCFNACGVLDVLCRRVRE
jgi:hypothetical protein